METERLIIDPIRGTDKEDYFINISHDKQVLETFICRYADSLEEFDFSTYPGRQDLFAIRLKETGRLIGIILYFDEKEDSCEIGYGIGSAFWNQGYATEAVRRFLEYLFREKGMHTVYASFFTGNDASRRVMEKCGMTYDHFSEKELTYLDAPRDLTYYAIHRKYITLRDEPELKNAAAAWFHSKWGVPEQAYLDCMTAYLNRETEYGWYLCLDGDRIIGGLGVIENDFHDRKDLTPNVCAVYTEEAYRGQGIAGQLLNMVVEDMRSKGISPLYLVTDHIGFYERYGWEFLCMVQGDGEPGMTRMYIHR
ncbi:MAG: GNAT family N-acetyltransferase [Lachnospiraceae bacterium]|nr:GNAT family N-acetyltransferase [Lachnospiraceae bacterium]